MVQRSQALKQLRLPTPYSLPITQSLARCAVVSHSLAHASRFLGLWPPCLTTLLSLCFSQIISAVLYLCAPPLPPQLCIHAASRCYSQTAPIPLCIHRPPLLICWPWFRLHNPRHQTQFPVRSLFVLKFITGTSRVVFYRFDPWTI